MFKILFVVGLTLFISTGIGLNIQEFTGFKQKYHAPLGFAALLFTLQMLYYPIQLFNLSSFWIHLISSIFFVLGFIFSVLRLKEIVYEYLSWSTVWIIASFSLFIVIFYYSSISIPRADGQMYLNYIAQNISINKLNNFNLWTGLVGEEFVTIYLFQGYFHFVAFINQFVNVFSNTLSIGSDIDSIVISMWGMGILYSLISSMLIISIVDEFKWKSIWINRIVILFTLFYTNMYYWKTAFAFYGNTWRSLFMGMFLYMLYRYVKEGNRSVLWLSAMVFGASISASSSSLFIGFSILLGFVFFQFVQKSEKVIQDASLVGFPMVLFVLGIVFKDSPTLFIPLLFITIAFYALKSLSQVEAFLKIINDFFSIHAIKIFLILLPLVAIIYSFWDMWLHPDYIWNMFHYFNNHANYDMVKDYFFIHSNWMDNVLNVIRWLSIIILIVKYRSQKENRYLLWHFALMGLFFLNPLTTSFISRMFASNVYYRDFEALFNVFTEILLLGYFLESIWSNKVLKSTSVILLISILGVSHFQSLILADKSSAYGFYINEGRTILPLYKIKNSELEVIKAMQEEYQQLNLKDGQQIAMVSHADGLRTFLPDIYQVFTARQYWSAWDRIDQDFYQVARRWYGWEERPNDIDFTKSCSYLKKYNIDYVINEIWENGDFDQAINECTEIIYENYEYRLRKVKK